MRREVHGVVPVSDAVLDNLEPFKPYAIQRDGIPDFNDWFKFILIKAHTETKHCTDNQIHRVFKVMIVNISPLDIHHVEVAQKWKYGTIVPEIAIPSYVNVVTLYPRYYNEAIQFAKLQELS
jgi:hypothetical protein